MKIQAFEHCICPGCVERFEFLFSPLEVRAFIGEGQIELEWPRPLQEDAPPGWVLVGFNTLCPEHAGAARKAGVRGLE